MDKEILRKLKLSGEIASKTRDYGARLIKEKTAAFEVARKVDEKIKELGAKPSFPTCISVNDFAAHYSPVPNDNLVLKEGDYVKLDLGAHVDGYISDTAITIIVGRKKDDLVLCSEKMLEKALQMFKPGTRLEEIGEAIENVAKEFKLNPIRNLTGHSLERFDLHAGQVVPNVKVDMKYEIKENEVYACEPFVTDGSGFVKESGNHLVFRYLRDNPVRMVEARKILELAKSEYEKLPFAKRWVQKIIPGFKLDLALKELTNTASLHGYPPLREVSGKNVAQTEHTIIVKDKPIITTL